jgi:hypothetical protein
MKLSPVEEPFRAKAQIVGSVFLLRPLDAAGLVGACRSQGIAVFGAEGFNIIGQKIQPSMEHSFDVGVDARDCYDATIEFLRSQCGGDLWFEVMVDALRQ